MKNWFKNKKNIFLIIAFLFYVIGIILNPIISTALLLFLASLFSPYIKLGLIMRLITTYLIYSSTLIVSGFLLYFLHIRFTLLIDLTLLLCLNALFILKIDRISLKTKLKDLFPKKELISLAVFVYVLVSMGGFLTSQNTLTKRIEQAGIGNDSVSHQETIQFLI